MMTFLFDPLARVSLLLSRATRWQTGQCLPTSLAPGCYPPLSNPLAGRREREVCQPVSTRREGREPNKTRPKFQMLAHIKRKLACRKLRKMMRPDPEYRDRRLAQFTPERRAKYWENVS